MTLMLTLALLAATPAADAAPCAVTLTLLHPYTEGRTTLPVSYNPQPGDIVLFRSSRIISNVVCHAVLCGGATHSGILVTRNDGTIALLETPYVGASVQFSEVGPALAKYKGRVWVRRRKTPLTPEQNANLTAFANQQEGKSYDFCGMLALPWCRPLQYVAKTSNDVSDAHSSSYFCSSLVIAACVAANLIEPREARPACLAPNDLMNDRLIDLSCGWEKPEQVLIESACGQ